MGMPLREYYGIYRAAELLECKVEDLLHWASIGAIKLFISFEQGNGSVRFFGDGTEKEKRNLDIFTEKQFESAERLREHLFENKYVSDAFSRVFSFYKHENFNLDSNSGEAREYPCLFNGLWSLPAAAYGDGALLDFNPGLDDFWGSINNNMFIAFESDEFLNFKIHELYIIKRDFEVIKNCVDGEELPNYMNGGIYKPKSESEKYSGSFIEDELSTKTINSRAQFIKSLLHIHYGDDVAKSPRRFLESKDSEINKDFKKQNIKAPSGRAAQSWVDEVEIPFDDE